MSGRTLRQLSSMLGLNHGEVRMDAGSGMRGKTNPGRWHSLLPFPFNSDYYSWIEEY